MKIENSPFHITKNSRNVSQEFKVKGDTSKISKNSDSLVPNKEEKSFWDWFRGLVNPFQNLPIISGIYSSINSEDANSDRDLVQNSLGGFMYGGPIGAIAGFGNWIFNKLFDKTPSELALEFTGISKLWKDEKSSEKNKEIVKNTSEQKKELNNASGNDDVAWWNKNQRNLIENQTQLVSAKSRQIKINSLESAEKKIHKDIQLANISSRYSNQNIITNKKVIGIKPKKLSSTPVTQINKSALIDNLEKMSNFENKILKKEKTTEGYRDLNFNYPTWSANENEIGQNIIDKSKSNHLKNKYLNIKKNETTGSNLNMKL